MERLGACIAARNEAGTIARLVADLRALDFDVFVLCDASTDDTYSLARAAGASVLDSMWRIGITAALMDAWRMALSAGCDRVLQIDAGGSHSVDDVSHLLAMDMDVVIGSRFMLRAVYHGLVARWLISQLAARMCNTVVPGAAYWDWTSGYRLFRADALRKLIDIPYHAKMHGGQIEVLYHAHRLGMTIAEVPITYVAGKSSFNFAAAREAFNVWRMMKNGKL